MRLPQDVLSLLPNYLLPPERQNKKIFEFSWDWRNFMNSNKEYFGEWKRESQFIRLSGVTSKKFLSSSFRNRVLQSVNNCSLQVAVRFHFDRVSKADLSKLPVTQSFEIEGSSVNSFVLHPETSFQEVRLNIHQVKSVARFQDVRVLSICVFYHATVDLSCLVKVEELEMRGLNLTNYHLLQNLKKAYFGRCTFSDEDIRCFSNLTSLTLSSISTTMDISALNEVPILKLVYCRNLSGWSALGKSRELFIASSGSLSDASNLGNVEKLSLRDFTGNISPLQNVIILDLSRSSNLTDVSCLADSAVRDLNLLWCSKVSDITMLRKVKKLNISNCARIVDLSGLLSLTELVHLPYRYRIDIQSGFQTLSQLINLQMGNFQNEDCEMMFAEALSKAPLKKLYLSEWTTSPTMIQLFYGLKYLQSLELVSFHGSLTIPAIPTLGELKISKSAISTLSIQSSNQNYPIYYLEIMHCTEFTEIVVNRSISFMKFCSEGVSEVVIIGEENIKDRFFKDVYLKPHK
jgi:hypothetical protein